MSLEQEIIDFMEQDQQDQQKYVAEQQQGQPAKPVKPVKGTGVINPQVIETLASSKFNKQQLMDFYKLISDTYNVKLLQGRLKRHTKEDIVNAFTGYMKKQKVNINTIDDFNDTIQKLQNKFNEHKKSINNNIQKVPRDTLKGIMLLINRRALPKNKAFDSKIIKKEKSGGVLAGMLTKFFSAENITDLRQVIDYLDELVRKLANDNSRGVYNARQLTIEALKILNAGDETAQKMRKDDEDEMQAGNIAGVAEEEARVKALQIPQSAPPVDEEGDIVRAIDASIRDAEELNEVNDEIEPPIIIEQVRIVSDVARDPRIVRAITEALREVAVGVVAEDMTDRLIRDAINQVVHDKANTVATQPAHIAESENPQIVKQAHQTVKRTEHITDIEAEGVNPHLAGGGGKEIDTKIIGVGADNPNEIIDDVPLEIRLQEETGFAEFEDFMQEIEMGISANRIRSSQQLIAHIQTLRGHPNIISTLAGLLQHVKEQGVVTNVNSAEIMSAISGVIPESAERDRFVVDMVQDERLLEEEGVTRESLLQRAQDSILSGSDIVAGLASMATYISSGGAGSGGAGAGGGGRPNIPDAVGPAINPLRNLFHLPREALHRLLREYGRVRADERGAFWARYGVLGAGAGALTALFASMFSGNAPVIGEDVGAVATPAVGIDTNTGLGGQGEIIDDPTNPPVKPPTTSPTTTTTAPPQPKTLADLFKYSETNLMQIKGFKFDAEPEVESAKQSLSDQKSIKEIQRDMKYGMGLREDNLLDRIGKLEHQLKLTITANNRINQQMQDNSRQSQINDKVYTGFGLKSYSRQAPAYKNSLYPHHNRLQTDVNITEHPTDYRYDMYDHMNVYSNIYHNHAGMRSINTRNIF